MASNNPFLNWLHGLTREEEPAAVNDRQPEAPVLPARPEPPPVPTLELPAGHPVHTLWSLWTEQAGWQPGPRFCLTDLKGKPLPEAEARRELVRLKLAVNATAGKRVSACVPKKTDTDQPPPPAPDLDAQAEVFLSADAMRAWVYVYPPVGKGKDVDGAAVRAALAAAKVTFGVDEGAADALPESGEKYFRLFPIAEGKPAVQGKDGRIIDLFPRRAERKIKTDEFNRVDYAALSFVQNVGEGEVVCHVIAPTAGEAGCTVLGKKISTRDGVAATVPKGRNTALSEDGSALLATRTGHVEFNGRTFQVRPVLEIAGNVDYSSGNINFLGDVHVHGDVCTGFTVRAMGTITIDGVVEAGTVEAGGDLIIVKGAQGDNRAVLRSSGSIYAKFLESCCVYAKENLQADCIISCDVYCDGAVNVNTGRGTIIGGSVRCAHEVNTAVLGSRAEAPTEVILGGMPCQGFDQETLVLELEQLQDELAALERQPESPTKFTRMGKVRVQISVNKSKLDQFRQNMDELEEEAEPGVRRLTCAVAYPGASVTIGQSVYHFVRETRPVVAYLDAAGSIQTV